MVQFTRPRHLQAPDATAAQVWARPGLGSRGGFGGDHTPSLLKHVYAQRAAAGDPQALLAAQMRPHAPPPKPLYLLPLEVVVPQHGGVCFKGKAATNPYRRCQDALVMEVDAATETLLVGVVDGHGEHGDRVASWVARELPLRLFNQPLWGNDPVNRRGFDSAIAVLEGRP
jgi:hypothetical protein